MIIFSEECIMADTAALDTQASQSSFLKAKALGSQALGEAKTLKDYFTMDGWNYLLVLGIALTGISALISTYDAISNINDSQAACANAEPLAGQLDTKFWVMLSVSIVAVLFGLVFAWFLRTKKSKLFTLVTLIVILMGTLGVLYAIHMKINLLSNGPRLVLSWVLFLAFLIAGIYMVMKKKTKTATIQFVE